MASNAFAVSDRRGPLETSPTILRIILDIPLENISEAFYNLDEFIWFYTTVGWSGDRPIEESYLYQKVKKEFDDGARVVYYVATPKSCVIKSDYSVELPANVEVIHGDEDDVVDTVLSLVDEL